MRRAASLTAAYSAVEYRNRQPIPGLGEYAGDRPFPTAPLMNAAVVLLLPRGLLTVVVTAL